MEEKVMKLVEKVKETASAVGDAAGRTVSYAGKRTGEIVETTKLNRQIAELSASTEALEREVGSLVYDAHKGVEIDAQLLEDKLAQIDANNEQIEDCRERILEFKNIKNCAACGCACDREDKFCRSCGAAFAFEEEE